MSANINQLFDQPKLTLTVLDPIETYDFDIISDKIAEQIKYVSQRLVQGKPQSDLPYDAEHIILPRQQTYIRKTKDSKFQKKQRNRMVWDEQKKGWILRKLKKRDAVIPPIIEATKQDAYEDVFRKREMQHELKKTQKTLRKVKKDKIKQKKIEQIKKQL